MKQTWMALVVLSWRPDAPWAILRTLSFDVVVKLNCNTKDRILLVCNWSSNKTSLSTVLKTWFSYNETQSIDQTELIHSFNTLNQTWTQNKVLFYLAPPVSMSCLVCIIQTPFPSLIPFHFFHRHFFSLSLLLSPSSLSPLLRVCSAFAHSQHVPSSL